jgi:hypothetical protein
MRSLTIAAITLVAMVDTAINQLQSSMNAYVTAGYYRGDTRENGMQIAAMKRLACNTGQPSHVLVKVLEHTEKNRRRF